PFREKSNRALASGVHETSGRGRCLRGSAAGPRSFGIHAKTNRYQIVRRRPAKLERKSVRTFVSCAQGDDGGLRARVEISRRETGRARRSAGEIESSREGEYPDRRRVRRDPEGRGGCVHRYGGEARSRRPNIRSVRRSRESQPGRGGQSKVERDLWPRPDEDGRYPGRRSSLCL